MTKQNNVPYVNTPIEQRVAAILSRETGDDYTVQDCYPDGQIIVIIGADDFEPLSDADVCDAIKRRLLTKSELTMRIGRDYVCIHKAMTSQRLGDGPTELAALMQALCNAFPEGE